MIQLPNDVVSVGYRETRPFQFEQVFHSAARKFTGTEGEFVEAGHGYEYRERDEFSRFVLKDHP